MTEIEPEPETETADPKAAARRRWTRLVVMGGVFLIGAALVIPAAPRDQALRLHLGAGSSRVVRATARVGREGAWDRQTTWQFPGGAPPSIDWTFELPNGAAEVEVELATTASAIARTVKVELGGGETRVELADAMRGLE